MQGIKSSACQTKPYFLVFFIWGIIFISCFHTQHGSLTMSMLESQHRRAGQLLHRFTERERERERLRKRGRESCRASDALPSSSNMEVGEQVSAIFLSFCSIVAFVMLFLQFVQFCFFFLYTIRKYFANFLYKKGNPF